MQHKLKKKHNKNVKWLSKLSVPFYLIIEFIVTYKVCAWRWDRILEEIFQMYITYNETSTLYVLKAFYLFSQKEWTFVVAANIFWVTLLDTNCQIDVKIIHPSFEA